MFFLNLIIILITLIYQSYNNLTLTKSAAGANKFLFANTNDDPHSRKIVKSFKIRLLQVNRIILLVTIIASILLIIFNKSVILLSIYIIIFLVLPFIFDRYYINNCIKQLKSGNHLHVNQDITPVFLDIAYNDKDGDNFYEYGLKRYLVNLGTLVGNLFSIMIIAIITAFLALIIIYSGPDEKLINIQADVTGSALVIEYDKGRTEVQFSDISSIEKKPILPKLSGDITGIKEGDYLLGTFSTKDYGDASLFVYKKAPTFLIIKTINEKYYVFSEENQANSNTIYEKIKENIPKDTAEAD